MLTSRRDMTLHLGLPASSRTRLMHWELTWGRRTWRLMTFRVMKTLWLDSLTRGPLRSTSWRTSSTLFLLTMRNSWMRECVSSRMWEGCVRIMRSYVQMWRSSSSTTIMWKGRLMIWRNIRVSSDMRRQSWRKRSFHTRMRIMVLTMTSMPPLRT